MVKKSNQRILGSFLSLPPKLWFRKMKLGEVFRPYLQMSLIYAISPSIDFKEKHLLIGLYHSNYGKYLDCSA